MKTLFGGFAESDPQRRGGEPVLKDTRFPIGQLIAQLAAGDSVELIAEDFSLDYKTVVGFLEHLAYELANSERIELR